MARRFAGDVRRGERLRRAMLHADARLLNRVRVPRGAEITRQYLQGEDFSDRAFAANFSYEEYVHERKGGSAYELVFSRHWSLTREYRLRRSPSTRAILQGIATGWRGWRVTFDNHDSAPPSPNNEVYLWHNGVCVFGQVFSSRAAIFLHHRTLVVTAAHMKRGDCS